MAGSAMPRHLPGTKRRSPLIRSLGSSCSPCPVGLVTGWAGRPLAELLGLVDTSLFLHVQRPQVPGGVEWGSSQASGLMPKSNPPLTLTERERSLLSLWGPGSELGPWPSLHDDVGLRLRWPPLAAARLPGPHPVTVTEHI